MSPDSGSGTGIGPAPDPDPGSGAGLAVSGGDLNSGCWGILWLRSVPDFSPYAGNRYQAAKNRPGSETPYCNVITAGIRFWCAADHLAAIGRNGIVSMRRSAYFVGMQLSRRSAKGEQK
jgi:hypothetical protein